MGLHVKHLNSFKKPQCPEKAFALPQKFNQNALAIANRPERSSSKKLNKTNLSNPPVSRFFSF
jgi:hypothetical protein